MEMAARRARRLQAAVSVFALDKGRVVEQKISAVSPKNRNQGVVS
jgi:hypothetical protein